MEIGPEKPARIVQPLEDPVPARRTRPARQPAKAPTRTPAPEKVPEKVPAKV